DSKLAASDEVRTAAERAGLVIEPGSTAWRDLASAILRAQARAVGERLDVFGPSGFQVIEGNAGKAPLIEDEAPAGERFSETLAKYLEWLRDVRKVRPATLAIYKAKAERFTKFANDPPLQSVTVDVAKTFITEIAKDSKPGTINVYHHICRA